jgi:transposase
MSDIPLNKFEKRDLVIKLHNEGHTYRDIAHMAHVSVRDIKPIIKKYEQQKRLENNKGKENNKEPTTKKLSLSSQAFTLFKEGKKLDEVKVLLDIPFKIAIRYWKQYLKSIRMYECFEFYEIFQNDLTTLLPISNFMKRNNVSDIDILNILREANDITNLNKTYYNLKTSIKDLEQRKMYLLSYSPSSYRLQPLPLNKPKYNYYSY